MIEFAPPILIRPDESRAPLPTLHAIRTLSAIRDNCVVDGDHWLWLGRLRYYGAPCMTFEHKTSPVRRVIASLIGLDFRPGTPIQPRCGQARCVSPICMQMTSGAALLLEARRRTCYRDNSGIFRRLVPHEAVPRQSSIAPMWAQLVRTA